MELQKYPCLKLAETKVKIRKLYVKYGKKYVKQSMFCASYCSKNLAQAWSEVRLG